MKKLTPPTGQVAGNPLVLPAAAENEWRLSYRFSPAATITQKVTFAFGVIGFALILVGAWPS